jgi:hypothetical protein
LFFGSSIGNGDDVALLLNKGANANLKDKVRDGGILSFCVIVLNWELIHLK